MGRVSELSMEKDEELATLHQAYEEAFEAMMLYMDKHDPSHRTIVQVNELARLTSVCEMAKFQYEKAESGKWKI